MQKFKRTAATPYTIITPSTPLAELEAFLSRNIFAIVTDWDRKFVLGVVTSQDMEVCSSSSLLLPLSLHSPIFCVNRPRFVRTPCFSA